MVLIFSDSDGNASVVHNINSVPIELREEGLLLDELPLVEQLDGKAPVLKVDLEQKEVWYDYVDIDSEHKEVSLEEIQMQTLLNTEFLVVMEEIRSL